MLNAIRVFASDHSVSFTCDSIYYRNLLSSSVCLGKESKINGREEKSTQIHAMFGEK